MNPEVIDKAKKIKLLVLDVDGVLTDGGIIFPGDGEETKVFHVRDGSAMKRGKEGGLTLAWVSGRDSRAVTRRAEELGVTELYQGIEEKWGIIGELMVRYSCRPEEVAYLGDDLTDLAVFEKVGFSATVADAPPAVKGAVDFVTGLDGGKGAAAELVDLILKNRG